MLRYNTALTAGVHSKLRILITGQIMAVCLQTRGKFGLGAKMALIWSKMTTGLPFSISSALRKQDFRSQYELDIDIHK
jgi:DNA topoisomerase VI subunit B